MSGNDDEKTEEPTQKKLDDAKKKGQVAFSREVSNFFMILALTLAIIMLLPKIFRNTTEILGKYISSAHKIAVEEETVEQIAGQIVSDSFAIIAMPFLFLFVAAIVASVIQNGVNISFESVKPKMEKISLKKGVKRMFSSRSLMEFVKGILKITIVGFIAYFTVIGEMDQLQSTSQLSMIDLLKFISKLALKILMAVTAIVFLIAVADFIYQKKEHLKQLRMSKQEIKDEYKQQEGDPLIKSKLKGIRMERARQRMMQSVPDADVVITNPTHYAVALQYDQDSMSAPKVLALGQDNIAKKIKEIAEENEIPIVRNAPLARALFDEAEIDEEIPLDHYQAVAEVISYVYKVKGKNPKKKK